MSETPDSCFFGEPFPLGATHDGNGTNIAVYAEHAEAIEVCLFGDGEPGSYGWNDEVRIELPEHTAHVFHGYLPGVGPGQRYGLRVHGPWEPVAGQRHNPNKLLIDPWARAIEGDVNWDTSVFGYRMDDPMRPNTWDSARHVPRSIIVDESFDWGDDAPPLVPIHRSVIYETHVRGMSIQHPDVPQELRGTYAGMAHPAIIDHLVALGVTAVELLPVHHFVSEGFLADRGLTNYWGYSTIGFFAPHAAYSASGSRGQQVTEFKELVKALHAAGLEVIIDVVYNHTTEGNEHGPTLSLRGIDNRSYYRLDDDYPQYYVDFTGTGNSLNVRHPAALQLVMDSLRYWVQEMRVDGFRFDLASTLARDLYEVDRLAAFFDLIHQDPIVNRVKLIAEPWDVGPGGYQVGNFPPKWSEWNAHFRDDIRDFWRGQPGRIADFAHRFTGSSDLYNTTGRRPSASINFITAHDGFTLDDLVTYNDKHNLANGENGRDGHSDNRSWNSGVEGPTSDMHVLERRRRRVRSMLATLMLSQGVPMLSGGDELGRSQGGNNNAYCQDNETSWYDWANVDDELLGFTRRLLQLRNDHPVFRRRHFFMGHQVMGSSLDDIGWFRPDGLPMTPADWHVGHARALSIFLNGNALAPEGPTLERTVDSSFLLLCNASMDPLSFVVPVGLGGLTWRVVLDTAINDNRDLHVRTKDEWEVQAWGVVLLERTNATPNPSDIAHRDSAEATEQTRAAEPASSPPVQSSDPVHDNPEPDQPPLE